MFPKNANLMPTNLTQHLFEVWVQGQTPGMPVNLDRREIFRAWVESYFMPTYPIMEINEMLLVLTETPRVFSEPAWFTHLTGQIGAYLAPPKEGNRLYWGHLQEAFLRLEEDEAEMYHFLCQVCTKSRFKSFCRSYPTLYPDEMGGAVSNEEAFSAYVTLVMREQQRPGEVCVYGGDIRYEKHWGQFASKPIPAWVREIGSSLPTGEPHNYADYLASLENTERY